MDLTSLSDLQTAMKLAGIRPHKGLGQHFLIDQPSLSAIMAAADLQDSDTVLEIGPGLGVMTMPLTQMVKQVVAVEADQTLAELLSRRAPANLEVVQADILTYNLGQLPPGYKVVANIPYYLTSKLMRLLMEAPNPPAMMSLLIQREVAMRITAQPGELSILALSVQFYAEASLVMTVERHKFWPSPEVDSAILRVVRRPKPLFDADPLRLFRLIKAGFGEKRKQLKNSLAGGLNLQSDSVINLLAEAKIKPQVRAQELAWAEWERLYRAAVRRGLI